MAISNYKIINQKTKIETELNEILLIEILKVLKLRKPNLYEVIKTKYEILEQKNFDEKLLE